MAIETYKYDGKRVLVIGGATGMGSATAKCVQELGAEVIVMDVADILYKTAQSIKIDLSKLDSVNAALNQISEPVQAVFSCAGVPDGVPPIMKINFISQRYIIEQLVERKLLSRGGAITMISSAAGLAWMQNLPQLLEFLSVSDWQKASDWVDAHEGTNSYMFSKQAMCAYVANKSLEFLKKGIRINSILPGPTDTPLARANADVWLGFGTAYRKEAGIEPLTIEQIGHVMAFFCSDAASGISGVNMLVDQGHISAATSGAFDDPDFAVLS